MNYVVLVSGDPFGPLRKACRRPHVRALPFALLMAVLCGYANGEQRDAASSNGLPDSILVLTHAPGLSAPDIETAVTNPLERHLIEVQGVRQVESRTIAGLSAIRVSFRSDIRVDAALAAIDARTHHAAGDLPSCAAAALVMAINFASARPLGYVVVEDEDVARAAEFARTRFVMPLNDIPDIGPLAVLGDRPRQLLIRLDRVKLQARNMSAQNVLDALKRYSPPLVSGAFRSGSHEYKVSFSPPMNAAEVSALPIGGERDLSRLRDVAQVDETVSSPARSVRVDGEERVMVPIYARQGSADAVCDAVHETVEKINSNAADGKVRFLPLMPEDGQQNDDSLLTIELRLPSGTRFEVTKNQCAEIEGIVREKLADDVSFIITEVGVGEGWPAAFSFNAAECDATLHVRLSERRKLSGADAGAQLADAIKGRLQTGAIERAFVYTSQSDVIEARVQGPPPEVRRRLESFLAFLKESFPHSRIVERLHAPAYQIPVNWQKAADLGIAPNDIQVPLAALTAGSGASWIDRQTGTRLQLAPDKEQVSAQDILNVPIIAARGQVRLGDVATLSRTVVPVEIDHFNLRPVVRAQFIIERSRRAAAISKLTVAADKLRRADEPRIEVAAP